MGHTYDVYICFSKDDRAVAHDLSLRLSEDGLSVFHRSCDENSSEEEESEARILLLLLSKSAIALDRAHLESETFRFRDPIHRDRRFIPLRLDDVALDGAFARNTALDWIPGDVDCYIQLLNTCRLHPPASYPDGETNVNKQTRLKITGEVTSAAFNSTAKLVALALNSKNLGIWDIESGELQFHLKGHRKEITTLAWSKDDLLIATGSEDESIRVWSATSGKCLHLLDGLRSVPKSLTWHPDKRLFVSGNDDGDLEVWDAETGERLHLLEWYTTDIICSSWSNDGTTIGAGAKDSNIVFGTFDPPAEELVLEGHNDRVTAIYLSENGQYALSASSDNTIRYWNLQTLQCLRVLEGHRGEVTSVLSDPGLQIAVSAATEDVIRIWYVATGRCKHILSGHKGAFICLSYLFDKALVHSCQPDGTINTWELNNLTSEWSNPRDHDNLLSREEHVDYTNAKVLLVGESGSGKTGLSMVLAQKKWRPTDSTLGAWATHWKLRAHSDGGAEREIWLWDFGGQADQRLIHQLYMDGTSLAVLVFNGQREDLFDTLSIWDRDITRASEKPLKKLLAAGRVDVGGIRANLEEVKAFIDERSYIALIETSAKTGYGCEELKRAIIDGIDWDRIPWRSSPRLFKRLRDEIIKIKDDRGTLLRFNELRDALLLRLLDESTYFRDEDLSAVISLLSGPGVVWKLGFGEWILLQPEAVNSYAQALIQTIAEDPDQRGYISEERVLNGQLTYSHPDIRLNNEEERIVLLAMHKLLVEKGLCIREHTDQGTMLIFPSFYRRERPELIDHPAPLMTFRFTGSLDEIYATLVVSLHHTKFFRGTKLWRYAVDFETSSGKTFGLKMKRGSEGAGEIVVYADPSISTGVKIVFAHYVHEFLLRKSPGTTRVRYYSCPDCNTVVGNPEIAMKRVDQWLKGRPQWGRIGLAVSDTWRSNKMPTIICAECEERISLWDDLEHHFASERIRTRVLDLQEGAKIVLDNESKDRALVGNVISTVALAGHICREISISDYGIDMEIEFKDEKGKATGKKLLLQLKSGDSHLKFRKRDKSRIFRIKDSRHAKYWMVQAFPVYLVIADSSGVVTWMEISDYLREMASQNNNQIPKEIVFQGELFDVMSIRKKAFL